MRFGRPASLGVFPEPGEGRASATGIEGEAVGAGTEVIPREESREDGGAGDAAGVLDERPVEEGLAVLIGQIEPVGEPQPDIRRLEPVLNVLAHPEVRGEGQGAEQMGETCRVIVRHRHDPSPGSAMMIPPPCAESRGQDNPAKLGGSTHALRRGAS